MRRRVLRILTASAAVLGLLAPAPAGARAATPSPALLLRAAAASRPVTLDLGGAGAVTLRLRPSHVLSPAVRFTTTDGRGRLRAAQREDVVPLAADVDGDPSGFARLTVAGRTISGYVFTRGRWIAFEPNVAGTGTTIAPAEPTAGTPAGGDDVVRAHGVLPPVSVGVLEPFGLTDCAGIACNGNCVLFDCTTLTAKIVLDGDVFYRALNPKTCQSRQIAILNGVDGIYQRQAGIHFEVTQVNCRTQADLGPRGENAATYLDKLRSAWTGVTADRSLVHLSVGFNLGSSTVGLSYLPGVCGRNEPSQAGSIAVSQSCPYGYGLHQAVRAPRTNYTASVFLQTKLAAHEIGHGFDAEHDPASHCPLKPPRRGPIMCAVLQDAGRNVFSVSSARTIRAWAEQTIGSITGT